jgi:hypothetical protein
MATTITGITHDGPFANKFKYKWLNTFYINGSGLLGADLDDLEGSVQDGARPVIWTDFGVLDNSDDSVMLVFGIPWKGHKLSRRLIVDSDGGDVTPTVSNDGTTVTNTVPTDYST